MSPKNNYTIQSALLFLNIVCDARTYITKQRLAYGYKPDGAAGIATNSAQNLVAMELGIAAHTTEWTYTASSSHTSPPTPIYQSQLYRDAMEG